MKKFAIFWLAASAMILVVAHFVLHPTTHPTARTTSTPAATRALTLERSNGLWEVGYEKGQLEDLVRDAEVTVPPTPSPVEKKATPKVVKKVAKATNTRPNTTPAAPHRVDAPPFVKRPLGQLNFRETPGRTGYQSVLQADDTLLEGWSAKDDSGLVAIVRAKLAQENQP